MLPPIVAPMGYPVACSATDVLRRDKRPRTREWIVGAQNQFVRLPTPLTNLRDNGRPMLTDKFCDFRAAGTRLTAFQPRFRAVNPVIRPRLRVLVTSDLGGRLDPGLERHGDLVPARPFEDVQVASIQTLYRRAIHAETMDLPRADLLVIDEAHHCPANTYTKIIESYPEAILLGLTATPCRGDETRRQPPRSLMITGAKFIGR